MKVELEKRDAVQFCIPLRSPDLNSIENVFNWVEWQLNHDENNNKILRDSSSDFMERVKSTPLNYPVETFDSIITLIPFKILRIIQEKGQFLKF